MENSVSKTFQIIKKLPLEVSFGQVEMWIHQYNLKEEKKLIANVKTWFTSFSKN